jgi:hypothetical protein
MNDLTRFLLLPIFLSVAVGIGANAQLPTASAPVDKPVIVPTPASLPEWTHPRAFVPQHDSPTIRSGELEVTYGRNPLDGFLVRVNGDLFGVGCPPSKFGYVLSNEVHWLECTIANIQKPNVALVRGQIEVSYQCGDPDGAVWQVTQRLRPQRILGTLEVQTEITVDQPRAVALVPVLLLFPGLGAFQASKGQGLFAGLEYLDNEPSSSEADVIGPAANRRVPDTLKVTFPLMAIQANGAFLGLSWQMRPQFSAVFDSPDRTFNSGAHVMGLLFPGSNGKNRAEGSLLASRAEVLHPNETLALRATILGGAGSSIVPAIQLFVKARPLPSLPSGLALPDYLKQASAGWLKSKIREGNLVRHALAAGSFKPQPAADAALWLKWLAVHDSDRAEQASLEQTAAGVLSSVAPDQFNSAGVGHIRYPVECLVFGEVARNAEQAAQRAQSLLSRFGPDGSVKYLFEPGQPDLGKTHSTNEASGLTSRVVLDLLEAATFCGKRDLITNALQHLRAMDRFHDGVPRGAQTWECPLHTPDILASAQMVRAYTLGYELTGDSHFLDEARYWAWTGIPFVYLVNPTEAPVGLYATIAVYGATQWRAPVWLGLPVQWCWLVYADALYRLLRADPKGPWKQVADGITLSGMQQSWTEADPEYAGLLPDSFVLRQQKRNGPAINPGTLEACAAQHFGQIPPYELLCSRTNSLIVHAPGRIQLTSEAKGRVSFQVESWVKQDYFVLINGLSRRPELKINGNEVASKSGADFIESQGILVLKLHGLSAVELTP